MKITMKMLVVLVICLSTFSAASCARQPSHVKSAKIIKSYFKKYGRRYPKTIYGKTHISNIDIISEGEIHKGLVSVEAFITMNDGTVRRIRMTIKKGSFGWRYVSWENASS